MNLFMAVLALLVALLYILWLSYYLCSCACWDYYSPRDAAAFLPLPQIYYKIWEWLEPVHALQHVALEPEEPACVYNRERATGWVLPRQGHHMPRHHMPRQVRRCGRSGLCADAEGEQVQNEMEVLGEEVWAHAWVMPVGWWQPDPNGRNHK